MFPQNFRNIEPLLYGIAQRSVDFHVFLGSLLPVTFNRQSCQVHQYCLQAWAWKNISTDNAPYTQDRNSTRGVEYFSSQGSSSLNIPRPAWCQRE
ncbi:hypothetical protein GN956_G20098 [Arapaima gigas]